MFERFTDRCRRVLVWAQEEARDLGHAYIGTEHILLGLIREGDGIAAEALGAVGVSYDAVHEKIKERSDLNTGASIGSVPFTPRAKKVLEFALRESMQLGHSYVGTEHVLLGLLQEGNGVATQILLDLGVELSLIRETVLATVSDSSGPGSGDPDSQTLREIVRSVGRRQRPDIEEPLFSERAQHIADDLFDRLRANWGEWNETP